MTESWATEELTEEQTAEMVTEDVEASEDAPAELNPNMAEDPDDPPQIDRSTPSERFDTGEEAAAKTESEEETTVDKPTDVEADAPAQKDGDYDAEWFNALDPDVQNRFRGLRGEIARVKGQRKNDNAESERRFTKMMESLPAQIIAASKAQEPPPPKPVAPDPDEDPDGFREFHEARSRETEAKEQTFRERDDAEKEMRNLERSVMTQESAFREEYADYDNVISAGRAAAIAARTLQNEVAKIPDAAIRAKNEFDRLMWAKADEINKQGGDFAAWAYHHAKSAIPSVNVAQAVKPQASAGEETAAAIAAGEKASKALGKTGASTSGGELTLEDIWNIKDGDEHEKAYDAWVDAQLKETSDWTPR